MVVRLLLCGLISLFGFAFIWPLLSLGQEISITQWSQFFSLDSHIANALLNTIGIGMLVAGISTIIGGAIAYAMTWTVTPGRKILQWLYLAPLLAPSFMPAFGLIYLGGNYGILWQSNLYGYLGLILGGVIFTIPHTTLQLSLSLQRLSPNLIDASRLLGANAWRRFYSIVLPHLKASIANAFLIAFVLTITDFGIPKLLGGNVPLLATEIYKYAIGLADFSEATILSLWLTIPSLIAFAVALRYSQQNAQQSITPPILEKNPLRDISFGCVAWGSVLFSLSSIFIVVVASFIEFWPYNLQFSLEAYKIGEHTQGWSPFFHSFILGILVAFLGTALTLLGALLCERYRDSLPSSLRITYQVLAFLPMAIPGTVLGLGYALGMQGFRLFYGVFGSFLLIICNTTFHLYTVGHLTLTQAIKDINPHYENVGLLLQRSYLSTTWHIIVPLLRKPLLETFGLLFSGALTAVSALIFIYNPFNRTAAVSALLNLDSGYLAIGAAYATLIFIMNLIVRALLLRLQR